MHCQTRSGWSRAHCQTRKGGRFSPGFGWPETCRRAGPGRYRRANTPLVQKTYESN
jgi:hypothetical protein